jgi:hypothetical protein
VRKRVKWNAGIVVRVAKCQHPKIDDPAYSRMNIGDNVHDMRPAIVNIGDSVYRKT